MNLNFEVKWKMITSSPEYCLHFPYTCLVNAFIGNLALQMIADSEIPSEKHLTSEAYLHPQQSDSQRAESGNPSALAFLSPTHLRSPKNDQVFVREM